MAKTVKRLAAAAALTLATLPADAAVVMVNFAGTYGSGTGTSFDNTDFIGAFSYDDATSPTSISYDANGNVTSRFYTNFSTAPFTITNKDGVSTVTPDEQRLTINYQPGSTRFTLRGFDTTSTPGFGVTQQLILTSNNPAFAPNGLSGANLTLYRPDTTPGTSSYAFGGKTGAGSIATLTSSSVTPPVSGVPEPATWAMMIGGFGLVGAAMRRRRKAASPAVA